MAIENPTAEEWRAVVGYEGEYEVSNLGRIRSLKPGPRRFGRIINQTKHSAGYLVFSASRRGGKQRPEYVHRAVMAAFGRPGLPGEQVDHIDFDRTNNGIDNLRWSSSLENNRHTYNSGRCSTGERHYAAKLSADDVREIRRLIAGGEKQATIAKRFGVIQQAISRIHRGEIWKQLL